MYMRLHRHGNHFKDKRPNLEKRPGGLWRWNRRTPAWSNYEAEFIPPLRHRAYALLDLAAPSR